MNPWLVAAGLVVFILFLWSILEDDDPLAP